MYNSPPAPLPLIPIVNVETFVNEAPLEARSISHAVQASVAISEALPEYGILVLPIFTYSWPVLPAVP
jgi:hypothetical protein